MKTKHLKNILARFNTENILRSDENSYKDRLEIATWVKLSGQKESAKASRKEVSLMLKFTDSQGQKTVFVDTTSIDVSKADALLSGTPVIKSVGKIIQMDLYIKNLPENMNLSTEQVFIQSA